MAPEPIRYVCPRAATRPAADGALAGGDWAAAPRTTRFADAATGAVAFLGTQAALLWDDEALYVGVWLEERDVWTTGAPRAGLTWAENTAEVFIAAQGAHYQLSVNAAGAREELLFVWKDAWVRGGRYDAPDLDLARRRPMVVGGDSGLHHPRGMRWLFDEWKMPGLRAAVHVDGTLNARHQIDRGWTVEIALPWTGMGHLLEGDGPPGAGQTLRVGLARNQVIDQRRARHTAVWSWHVAGAAGLYAPEGYPTVALAADSPRR